MKSPKYGQFDFDSIGERVKCRKVYGSEPRVQNDPESFFECFFGKIDAPESRRKTATKGMDRAAFIFDRIRELENDIQRYNSIGKTLDRIEHGKPKYFNFRKLIPKVEKEIKKLYEYL